MFEIFAAGVLDLVRTLSGFVLTVRALAAQDYSACPP